MGAASALRPPGLVHRLALSHRHHGAYEGERPVIVWRIDLAFLEQQDWKYEGSGAGP